jgi:hypothetical protein
MTSPWEDQIMEYLEALGAVILVIALMGLVVAGVSLTIGRA